ncbi:MAG TPA: ABC transporter permease [Gemmatimonadaceae bacterium]|nr:ABC transporter permease [Gemmatimonadaceae bacterium]
MLNDLRLAARGLLRTRGLSAAAVLCLALGIAGTTIVYSVTNAIVLHPVPTPDATGLVHVTEVSRADPSPDASAMAPANYIDLMQRNHSFAGIAAFRGLEASVTGIDDPERVNGYRVTPSYFRLLGVRPALGRTFTDDDARYAESPDVVILSDGFWHRHFGADSGVIGRVLRINDVPRTIVGVMPPGFVFPTGAELWTPQSLDGAFSRDRGGRVLTGVLARLRPGVSLVRARADVHAIMQQLAREHPDDDGAWDMRVDWANSFYGQHPRPFMLAELAAVALVLLLACANVANLLLARATTRAREIAVRVALGASRLRIVRLQLAESALLAAVSGVVGTLLAVWGVAAVRAMLPTELVSFNPGWTRIEVSGVVLGFTALVSIGTALLVGAVPAFVASGAAPQHALNEGGRGGSEGKRRHGPRGLLVAAEMAIALTMLAGTLVTVRGFAALLHEPPGYRVDHALTMQLTAPIARYSSETAARSMYERVLDEVRAVPGVVSAAYANALPPDWNDAHARVFLDGEVQPRDGEPARSPRRRIVSPDYFAAMRVSAISGRIFNNNDDSRSGRVVVVNEAMARAYWPGRSAVGMRLGTAGADTAMATVVGVVADVRENPNDGPAVQPTFYAAMAQAPVWRTMSLVARTTEHPAAMAHRIEQAVERAAPTVAPGNVLTLEQAYADSLAPQRITSEMMAAFALVALLLAALGIHGVLSYSVAQRTHDIGVRTALGAGPRDVVGAVLGAAMRPVAIGMAIGLVGAAAMVRGLAHLLTQLSGTDPLALAGAVLILIAAALAGCVLPARRAMRVDPTVALRSEA